MQKLSIVLGLFVTALGSVAYAATYKCDLSGWKKVNGVESRFQGAVSHFGSGSLVEFDDAAMPGQKWRLKEESYDTQRAGVIVPALISPTGDSVLRVMAKQDSPLIWADSETADYQYRLSCYREQQ